MEQVRGKHACCFAVEVFDDDQFNPAAFVASTRSLVPLERLRDDLQEHLRDRKQELFDLINRDYADFILVSTKLSGVGGKVADLREPMARLLTRASGLQSSAELAASKLEAKLEDRRGLRERKASIQRFIRFTSTLDTAEGILGIGNGGTDRMEDDIDTAAGVAGDARANAFDDGSDGGGAGRIGGIGIRFEEFDEGDEGFDDPDLLAAFPGLSGVEEGVHDSGDGSAVAPGTEHVKRKGPAAADTPMKDECALLERAAHYALMMNADLQAAAEDEVNGSGDAEAASLLKGMASRASRVESEITRRLRLEFASLVKPVQAPTGGSVAGLVGAKEGGVTGGEGTRERKRQALLSCLRPFSALGSGIEAEKQFARAVMQPFLDARFTQGMVDGGERGSSKALGTLFDELLAYVKGVAGDAIEAAEDMFIAPQASAEGGGPHGAEAGTQGDGGGVAPLPVDLVCNGVWRPVQQVLTGRLSGIFATGMVAAQRTNYTLCMEFLEGLTGIGGEGKRPGIRRRLLGQATVAEFKARWNLPIYFQLRSREVSSRLEAALSAAVGRSGSSTGETGTAPLGGRGVAKDEAEQEEEEAGYDGPSFELRVFREAWRCLLLCWDSKVFLPCLAHRFLRLSLQGIGRMGKWAGSAEVLALSPDDIVPVASDLDKLLGALKTDFVSVAARSIAAPAAGERHRAGEGALEKEEAKELVGEAVAEAVGAWGVLVENLWEKATSQVAEKCMAMLQAVKGITATYRMTNKPAPQRPSPFVPNVLRALREFDARWGSSASGTPGDKAKGARLGWKDRVVLTVCTRYLEIVSELLLTVRQMENTLNKRRVTARRSSRGGAGDQGPSDKDKIMMQLRLDVSEFGKEAARLGVDVSPFPPYERLLEVVEAGGEGASINTAAR